jgi:hypothetical protein
MVQCISKIVEVRIASARTAIVFMGLVLAISGAAPHDAWALGVCRFPPTKPVTLKDMGPCKFDLSNLSFEGEPEQQAACLLSPVRPIGKLDPPLKSLPEVLAKRVGRSFELPDREAVHALLREQDLENEFGTGLSLPVSHAHDNDPISRSARYFVIHDTSAPNYGARAWPKDINQESAINNLDNYRCENKIERAHVFINRAGQMMLSHDFTVPWRATKFEMATNFNSALKGLFLHNELIQPRRRFPGRGRHNDFLAPEPGFTPAQYDRLALVYVVASVRTQFWLIPAYHAVIDEGIYDKHDDPQNFELEAFAGSLEKLLERLRKPANRS